ncbi:transferase [Prevotella lacticifex]|jgi:acetyltransferase-like isoleucine patch superfamily enzyme|uniref:Acetyltransferase n=1 Tax=Prevotella lacticifex TaxID=2854755 RepID=A0A9R1C902_9BACT|nr:transferase [Prevotella lacticifex]GJG37461.1 hypothetical protein PRLR5003_26180 [Prevotella lacticifex]GJG40642.1 hypothetical protein PRLR5019_26130 [Prevotella lacticifex]GJG44339.1 hypothetical protein PRLR5025_31250 [Prevotella lacticifex]GJG47024.1 hypothetical protein PRLR5027_26190 [Prevotella lacticifex]GJG50354.1 hypothetical protein PRLR5052_27670 [Prevotella lacticifex]
MNTNNIYLLGVGHATPLFIELAEACGYHVAGLYHYNEDRTGETDHGFPILGSFADLLREDLTDKNFCLTMGDMAIKQSVSLNLIHRGGVIPSLIHPTAVISRFADVSPCGVLVDSYCEIDSNATVEEGCVLRPHAMVSHDSHLFPYTFMGPKAYVGAYTDVESKAFIGQCSVLVSGKAKHIGKDALVGAGSVVVKPVSDKAIVAGNPARILKYKP